MYSGKQKSPTVIIYITGMVEKTIGRSRARHDHTGASDKFYGAKIFQGVDQLDNT